MLKIKKIFYFFFLNIILLSPTFAENKVVYLDLDFLLTNTNLGKKTFKTLEKKENDKNNELKLIEKNLKEEENKILASRNIITEEQFEKNIRDFKKKINSYSKKKNEVIEELKINRNNEVIELLNKINPIIENYMDNSSISIIIDKKNIYIANVEYDITNKLIELINNEF